jgi:hypothetical protein
MNYNDTIGFDKLEQWAKNRLTYQEDKNLILALIKENENWINYYEVRSLYPQVVVHKERLLQLEKQLVDLEKGLEITN